MSRRSRLWGGPLSGRMDPRDELDCPEQGCSVSQRSVGRILLLRGPINGVGCMVGWQGETEMFHQAEAKLHYSAV